MPKDWKDITVDEILNFEGSQTAFMARYERIMQQRSIEAVDGLRDKITGLMETIYRSSQALQERVDKLNDLYDRGFRSQTRQQNVLIGLSIVVALSTAAYTWITWQSVAVMRDANDIQRQSLELQKAQQQAARKSGA